MMRRIRLGLKSQKIVNSQQYSIKIGKSQVYFEK